MYPDRQVTDFIGANFMPVRIHIKDNAEEFKKLGARYGARWTPTLLVIDHEGVERHRIEGFVPKEELLGQLALGLAHSAFARTEFTDAERRFRDVVARYPGTDAGPEALYWAGVSQYKATGDGAALASTATAFQKQYPDTIWAKKASVWGS